MPDYNPSIIANHNRRSIRIGTILNQQSIACTKLRDTQGGVGVVGYADNGVAA